MYIRHDGWNEPYRNEHNFIGYDKDRHYEKLCMLHCLATKLQNN
jgi:hypothetical protein